MKLLFDFWSSFGGTLVQADRTLGEACGLCYASVSGSPEILCRFGENVKEMRMS